MEVILLESSKLFVLCSCMIRYKWIIPFIYKLEGKDGEFTEWMKMGSAEIEVPKGTWVIGNVDYMGFYRTNYDADMWQLLTEQLQKDHTVSAVLCCISISPYIWVTLSLKQHLV